MLECNGNDISIIGKKCIGCASCFQACEKNAIVMEEDVEGFRYPMINRDKCINCGICLKKCPIAADIKKSDVNFKKVYAAYNLNDDERYTSSSGGIFVLLAKEILSQDGVVYGVAYSDCLDVLHVRIDKLENLYILLKSKYAQSQNINSYKECRKDLLDGRLVLYTGTPCQIGALKVFLGKDYSNLITQDIICHGVPSNLVWRNRLHELQVEADNPVIDVDFRSKVSGWKFYHLSYKWKNGKQEDISRQKEHYFLGFNASLYLRKSCYSCRFKEDNNCSDISLGDFWAVESIAPVMNDNRGVSIVFINSEKGRVLFDESKEHLRYMPVNYELVCKKHNMIRNSANNIKGREIFFKEYNGTNLNELVHKFLPRVSFRRRIKRKAISVVKKIIR